MAGNDNIYSLLTLSTPACSQKNGEEAVRSQAGRAYRGHGSSGESGWWP